MMDEIVLKYNALDSAITKDIQEQIWDDLSEQGHDWAYNLTIRCLQPFMYMMTRGVLLDVDGIKNSSITINKQMKEKQAELDKLCGHYLNANSPKQCIEYFYIKKGIKPFTKSNAKGGSSITTDDKAMQRLAIGSAGRKPIPEAKLVQDIRGLVKLSGTYIDIDFDDDNRFRCSINPRGTVTGRISTSKTIFGTGMNMQNLPPSFKSFIIPDPGYILIEPDLAGAEWVVVAYLSGDANMLNVVENKLDPHAYTASLMFDVPQELVQQENKLIGHVSDPAEIERIRYQYPQLRDNKNLPRSMSMRQAGKKSNHGLNYDEGYRTFALQNEIQESEGKRLVNLYHSIYPGIRRWHENIRNQLQKDRTLTNCFGRKRRFLDIMGDKLYKAAYAQIPQSTVSDNLNLGMCAIYEDTGQIMNPCQLLLQVHDSMPNQYPDDDVGSLANCIQKQKEYLTIPMTYGGRTFNLDVDFKVGYNWGQSGMKELQHVDDFPQLVTELEGIVHHERS